MAMKILAAITSSSARPTTSKNVFGLAGLTTGAAGKAAGGVAGAPGFVLDRLLIVLCVLCQPENSSEAVVLECRFANASAESADADRQGGGS
jgi:hypothetical protein